MHIRPGLDSRPTRLATPIEFIEANEQLARSAEQPHGQIMAIDLRDVGGEIRHDNLDHRLTAALGQTPWITVGIVDGHLDPALHDVADAMDLLFAERSGGAVVVDVDDINTALTELRVAVDASPQAAHALVWLLRLGQGQGVNAALFAESLANAMLQSSERFVGWLGARKQPVAADGLTESTGPSVAAIRSGSHLAITLNRPSKRNALNVDMQDHLADALDLLAGDDSIDGATLTGAGATFSSGRDLSEFGSARSAAAGHDFRMQRSLPMRFENVADRLRVHLHGPCVGAGVELPAFVNHVVADPDTTFTLPDVGCGLIPGAGGTVSVTRRCGRHRTAWLALTGNTIDSETALAWGLIDRIAPAT